MNSLRPLIDTRRLPLGVLGKNEVSILRNCVAGGPALGIVRLRRLIGLIAGTYRRMALAKALQAQGATPAKIFSEVRMPSFKQGAYLSMLNQIDSGAMAEQVRRIAEADLAIKTSKATPRMQVEMLVCELMG